VLEHALAEADRQALAKLWLGDADEDSTGLGDADDRTENDAVLLSEAERETAGDTVGDTDDSADDDPDGDAESERVPATEGTAKLASPVPDNALERVDDGDELTERLAADDELRRSERDALPDADTLGVSDVDADSDGVALRLSDAERLEFGEGLGRVDIEGLPLLERD
jgi:hypothetical protein